MLAKLKETTKPLVENSEVQISETMFRILSKSDKTYAYFPDYQPKNEFFCQPLFYLPEN